jgi:hypothetical protein
MTGLLEGSAVLGKRYILPCAITYDITERYPSAKRRSIGCEDRCSGTRRMRERQGAARREKKTPRA